MNSILITGGSGFIGSNFIRLLLSNNASLLKENGYDHLINLDALTYAGNPANLADLEDSEAYEFVHASILEQERELKSCSTPGAFRQSCISPQRAT